MKILGIETSCDETGIALLNVSEREIFDILSNIVSSQIEIHKKYGGVYPMLAKREHQNNLVLVLKNALKQANLLKKRVKIKSSTLKIKIETVKKILEREKTLSKKIIPFLLKYKNPDIDLIAVTQGPGLEPCLWVGINFAKALSFFWKKPVIPVNHIESHILVNLLPFYSSSRPLSNLKIFPAIALIVSGGHTQLILVKNIGIYKILGETRDDAAGECFDKCAKILGLEYPGGPLIEKLAKEWSLEKLKDHSSYLFDFKLPRPMVNSKDYDFSFSGLKTALLYYHLKQSSKIRKSKNYIKKMSFETQEAIIDVLVTKTLKAVKNFKVKSLILGGGVAANKKLKEGFRERIMKEKLDINFIFPEENFCTDNAVMIAIAGYFHRKQETSWENLKAKANLSIT